jgi:hypothetical protein
VRRFLFILCVLLALIFLAACASQAVSTQAPAAESVEVTKVVQVEEPASAEASATAAPAAPTKIVKPLPTSPPAALTEIVQPPPTTRPALPTPVSPSPTAVFEERIVELEWPSRLRLGDSDVLRLSLVPSAEGYVVQADFPEHAIDAETVQVEQRSGYELSGVARLDAVGFDVSPEPEQVRSIPEGESVNWQWVLRPREPGQQRLAIVLWLRWTPLAGEPGPIRESEIFSRSLDVAVTSFFGMSRRIAMTGGFLGLLLGGGLSLFALAGLAAAPHPRLLLENPNPSLVIETRPGMSLSAAEQDLLRALFKRYARLVIESEFLSGYSGARTFLVLPLHPDGRADAHTIVKVGESEAVRNEYENYERYVKDTLPPMTARIQRVPVTLRGSSRAALQYTFIGAPGQPPLSLRQAWLQNPDPTLLFKLFDTFGPNWWMQRKPYTFRLGLEYDRVLPTHFVVEPARGGGKPLDGRLASQEISCQIGDLVTLRNFPRSEKRADGQSQALLGIPAAGLPSLRVRWLSLANPEGAAGRVVATRYSLLQDTVAGFDRLGLADPLERLPGLLQESVSGTQSTIHGDLNLENILVGLGGFVWLIDFAMTRDGHTLHDFAHLGAEIIAHILSPQVTNPADYLSVLRTAFPVCSVPPPMPFTLLCALQEIAYRCLFNPSQPREFHMSLALTCLGALKYANLQPFQKHLLYLTAAFLTQAL